MQDPVALILAGGRGTRIAHLHPNLPKPAVPVAGKPFLAHLLNQLSLAGLERIVISTGHLGDVLEAATRPWIPDGIEIRWVREEVALGTGGGASWAAMRSNWSPQRWLIMNGDSFLSGDWTQFLPSESGAALIARKVPDVSRYGSLMFRGNQLLAFSEKSTRGPGWINAGIYLLPTEWMTEIEIGLPSSLETDWFPRWLGNGRKITVFFSEGRFLDIGTPESLATADDFFGPKVAGYRE